MACVFVINLVWKNPNSGKRPGRSLNSVLPFRCSFNLLSITETFGRRSSVQGGNPKKWEGTYKWNGWCSNQANRARIPLESFSLQDHCCKPPAGPSPPDSQMHQAWKAMDLFIHSRCVCVCAFICYRLWLFTMVIVYKISTNTKTSNVEVLLLKRNTGLGPW